MDRASPVGGRSMYASVSSAITGSVEAEDVVAADCAVWTDISLLKIGQRNASNTYIWFKQRQSVASAYSTRQIHL